MDNPIQLIFALQLREEKVLLAESQAEVVAVMAALLLQVLGDEGNEEVDDESRS